MRQPSKNNRGDTDPIPSNFRTAFLVGYHGTLTTWAYFRRPTWNGFLFNAGQTFVISTLTLSQCKLAGPVYTGMPLADPVYTAKPLGVPANTCMVHWNTTEKKLIETIPHWNATGEALKMFAHTGTPLEKLSWNCPTLGCYWRNFCSLHWNTTGGTITAPHPHPPIHTHTHAHAYINKQ